MGFGALVGQDGKGVQDSQGGKKLLIAYLNQMELSLQKKSHPDNSTCQCG